MLEYFDDKSNKWIALNSFKSSEYLENITQNKYTIKELFKKADPKLLIYDKYSNLNYQLVKIFGYKYDIPYIFSYIMDEVYILKIIFDLFILILVSIVLIRLNKEK
jgi:hypothetical protein